MSSLSLAFGDIGVSSAVTVREVGVVVAVCTTLGAIYVKQTGDTLAVTLTTSPIVTGDGVLHGLGLLLLGGGEVLDAHSHLANHELVLTQDKVLVVSSVPGLGNGVDCSFKVDLTLGVIEVRKFTIFVDENRDFTKKMRTTEVTIFPLDLHVKLHASTTKKLEALDLSETETVKGQQIEAHL